jgi:Acyltransferase
MPRQTGQDIRFIFRWSQNRKRDLAIPGLYRLLSYNREFIFSPTRSSLQSKATVKNSNTVDAPLQGFAFPNQASQLKTLTQINLEDLVASFGWQGQPLLAGILRALFIGPARKFARQVVDYDRLVGQVGLHEASRQFLKTHYIHELYAHGREHVPTTGPILVLSNHPGLADTACLFAAIHRADLRIIATHRPFLAALDNITKQLSYISDDASERMRAVRQISTHLKNGGAALTFPAGKIEPDPALHGDALDSLNDWTDSSGVFLRFAPQTKIVPVIVSGVVWERAARHWLTRLKRTRADRERLATALHLLAMVVRNARPTTVHVRFAEPITVEELGSRDSADIHKKLMERMQCLIQNQNDDDGVSLL